MKQQAGCYYSQCKKWEKNVKEYEESAGKTKTTIEDEATTCTSSITLVAFKEKKILKMQIWWRSSFPSFVFSP